MRVQLKARSALHDGQAVSDPQGVKRIGSRVGGVLLTHKLTRAPRQPRTAGGLPTRRNVALCCLLSCSPAFRGEIPQAVKGRPPRNMKSWSDSTRFRRSTVSAGTPRYLATSFASDR